MAFPQPERSELEPTGDRRAPESSLADAHPAGASPGAVWLTLCAWCDRTRVRGRWIDAAQALEVIDAAGTHQPRLTHGICPTCFDEVNAQAERERRARDGS